MVGAFGGPDAPLRRSVGGDARRPAARRLPAAADDGPALGHDQQPPRRRSSATAARRGSSPGLPAPGTPRVDPAAGAAARCRRPTLAIIGDFVPFGIGQALGLTRRAEQPRQHAARRAPRTDRVGARRRACARRRRRLRPRPRAPLGRGRNAPRHREPVDDRALAPGAEEPQPDARSPAVVRRRAGSRRRTRDSFSPACAGWSHEHSAALRHHVPASTGCRFSSSATLVRELVDLGYTDLWSAESGGYDAFIPLAVAAAVGAGAAPRYRDRARVHARARTHSPRRSRRCARPRPGGSRSASARRRT